ncbi:MAG TPA: hypothetical protein VM925_13015 [Labilithrix sp.]|nr:hypothetical protein [Labilithrix sp.]
MRKVRQLLREKNPAAALAELDRSASRLPGGPLEEEREVLTFHVSSSRRAEPVEDPQTGYELHAERSTAVTKRISPRASRTTARLRSRRP